MRTAVKIALFAALLAVVVFGGGFLLPRQVHVERSAVVDARPATVHVLLNGFRIYNTWSPWFELDPQAKYTVSGPDAGVGAKLAWASDKKDVGSGSQVIVESRAPELVKTALDFGGMGTATSEFRLTPEGEGTRIVWGLDSDMGAGPIGRWSGLLMDRMVGKDFEKGLAALQKVAAGLPKEDLAGLEVSRVEVAPITVAYVPAASPRDDGAYAAALGAGYGQVAAFMSKHGVKQAAPVLAISNKEDASGYQFDAAIPLDRAPDRPIAADSRVQVKQTYGGPALKIVHKGSYHALPATYARTMAYMQAAGYEPAGAPWDEFVSDPGETPEAELLTHIYVPVR